jgi:hypothetical protein
MPSGGLHKLAQARIDRCLAMHEGPSDRGDVSLWAFEAMDKLCREDPESAWIAILEVLKQTTHEAVLESLSAGPLETLLAYNGGVVIGRVEREARSNMQFQRLLQGVYERQVFLTPASVTNITLARFLPRGGCT